MLRRVAGQGLVAGLTGTALMTEAEKVEQRLSGRSGSCAPARVPARLTGPPEHRRGSRALNLALHHGQGTLLAVLRQRHAALVPGRRRDVAPSPR